MLGGARLQELPAHSVSSPGRVSPGAWGWGWGSSGSDKSSRVCVVRVYVECAWCAGMCVLCVGMCGVRVCDEGTC